MNLATLASHVCNKVRQTDTEAVARCKEFISDRYNFIWAEGLWRDSIYQYNIHVETVTNGNCDIYNNPDAGLAGHYLFPRVVDRVLSIRRDDGELSIDTNERMFQSSPDLFAETGTPVRFTVMNPAAFMNVNNQTLFVEIEDASDTNVPVTFTYIDHNGERKITTVNANGIFPSSGTAAIALATCIERVTKPATTGGVWIVDDAGTFGLKRFDAEETIYEPTAHVLFTPAPDANVDMKALVKKKAMALTSDYDQPELRGVDNCLMAFAQGDMLQRARQYTKADNCYQQGIVLLKQLKDQATIQERTRQFLVPDCESADVNFYPNPFSSW